MQIYNKNINTVLFQGDSVTDVFRIKDDLNSLGNGYAMMIAAYFSIIYPKEKFKFLNLGIDGNRVRDLKSRWQRDCLDHKPDLVSILIGVNDCWRRYDSNDPTSVEKFAADYESILKKTQEHLNAQLVLCEPFVLPVTMDQRKWREDLDPKIDVVRMLARKYNALLVPLDGAFNRAASYKKPTFWTLDGVHPTYAGHALIAKEWLETVRVI